ncbi:zinc ribbon domain-containing protein [Clostridium peptidivorans]|uniref:zinc ribbon domain-containing protein n=1 Tax=Clostridium peptidivorans TaxID=100174 RepID=UPI000BE31A98|nr:C4-type zinc ribbon domain-containing protein [Clostridium peptidivorans]
MSLNENIYELQNEYDKMNNCDVILNDNSYKCELKKLKKQFENFKVELINKDESLKQIKEEIVELNNNINSLKKEIEDGNYKLYNKSGANLKVIDIINNKLDNDKKMLVELDSKIIDMLEREEKIQEERKSLREKLVNIKEEFYNYKEKESKKINEANTDKKLIEKKISNIRGSIPKRYLDIFDEIKSRNKKAAVKLKDRVCEGCKIQVSAFTIDNINKDNEITFCDNCGRILFSDKRLENK